MSEGRYEMVDSDQIIIDALAILADLAADALSFHLLLRQQDQVVNGSNQLSIVRRPKGVLIECYVEAHLAAGRIVCWMVDIYLESPGFRIERSILINEGGEMVGQRELSPLRFDSLPALLLALRAASIEFFQLPASFEADGVIGQKSNIIE
jgi:hypothetical protein